MEAPGVPPRPAFCLFGLALFEGRGRKRRPRRGGCPRWKRLHPTPPPPPPSAPPRCGLGAMPDRAPPSAHIWPPPPTSSSPPTPVATTRQALLKDFIMTFRTKTTRFYYHTDLHAVERVVAALKAAPPPFPSRPTRRLAAPPPSFHPVPPTSPRSSARRLSSLGARAPVIRVAQPTTCRIDSLPSPQGPRFPRLYPPTRTDTWPCRDCRPDPAPRSPQVPGLLDWGTSPSRGPARRISSSLSSTDPPTLVFAPAPTLPPTAFHRSF